MKDESSSRTCTDCEHNIFDKPNIHFLDLKATPEICIGCYFWPSTNSTRRHYIQAKDKEMISIWE